MIKVIAFDLVGVLLREKAFPLSDIEDKIERTFGKEISDNKIISDMSEKLGLSKWEIIEKMKYIINNIYDIKFNPGYLKDEYPNIKLVVASNHVKYINEYLNKHFKNTFDDILISGSINKFKPNSDFYNELINVCDAKPSEILFLDDNKNNIEGALKLGITSLLINKNDDIKEKLSNILKTY